MVAILDSSVNCVCVWSTKKLTMPAYCVAANCNNLQTTPGITMHELPRNRPTVNCVCVWSTKKLTMPAFCVAANCNNSQTTPGITMQELPRNRPAATVRQKWIKFMQFKRADFLAGPHHAPHLCSEHFSECDFANPWNNAWGLL